MFFSYLRYITTNIFRNTFIYITLVAYFFVLIFLFFIMPSILSLELVRITRFSFFFILLMAFAVVNISSMVSAIFRQSIDDGSELIFSTKPISRMKIIYAKIFLFLLVTLVMAGVSSILSYLTQFTYYGDLKTAEQLALNMFIATVIIYLSFGALSVIFSMFFKRIGNITCTIAVFVVLMIYSVVTNYIFMSIPKYLSQRRGIDLTALSLVKQDPQDQTYSYQWGANGALNSSSNYISQSYYQEYLASTWGDSNQYLQAQYKSVNRQNNFDIFLSTNIIYQLASIYTWPTSDFLNQPYYVIQRDVTSSTSFNIKINFDTQSLNHPDLLTFSSINDTSPIKQYYLANNFSLAFQKVKTFEPNFKLDSKTQYSIATTNAMSGKLDFLNYESSTLPYLFWSANGTPALITRELTNSIGDLSNFIKSYFIDYTPLFNENITPLMFWSSIFGSSLLNQPDLVNKPLLATNQLALQILAFQKITFEALKNFDRLQLTVSGPQRLQLWNNMFSVFNFAGNQNNYSTQYVEVFFVAQINELMNAFTQISQDPELTIGQTSLSDKGYIYTPFLYAIDSEFLPTFNFIEFSPFYYRSALLSSWLAASLILFTIGVVLYSRYNFS